MKMQSLKESFIKLADSLKLTTAAVAMEHNRTRGEYTCKQINSPRETRLLKTASNSLAKEPILSDGRERTSVPASTEQKKETVVLLLMLH